MHLGTELGSPDSGLQCGPYTEHAGASPTPSIPQQGALSPSSSVCLLISGHQQRKDRRKALSVFWVVALFSQLTLLLLIGFYCSRHHLETHFKPQLLSVPLKSKKSLRLLTEQ